MVFVQVHNFQPLLQLTRVAQLPLRQWLRPSYGWGGSTESVPPPRCKLSGAHDDALEEERPTVIDNHKATHADDRTAGTMGWPMIVVTELAAALMPMPPVAKFPHGTSAEIPKSEKMSPSW